MKLIVLTILSQCIFLSSFANEASQKAMATLMSLGYNDIQESESKTSKPGAGQLLLLGMKGFEEKNGAKKAIWQNTPKWSTSGWDKVSKEDKDKVANTFLNDPEFLSYSVKMSQAVKQDCSLGIPIDDEEQRGLLQRQVEYGRFLANRSIFLIESGQIGDAFNETLAGLRLMSKTFNSRTDALSGRACITIFDLHVPQVTLLLESSVSLRHHEELLKELQGINTKLLNKGEIQRQILYARSLKADSLTDLERKRIFNAIQMKYMNSILSGKPSPEYFAAKERFEKNTEAWLSDNVAAYLQELAKVHKLTEPGRAFADDLKLLESVKPSALEPRETWKSLIIWERTFAAKCRLLNVLTALKIQRLKTGSFPEALNNLDRAILAEQPLDPFTGEPFVYAIQEGNVMLYSLGPDQMDDSGKTFRAGSNKGDIAYKLNQSNEP